MSDYIEKQCSQCGQKLRFPRNVGGLVMVCPTCGQKFGSDFKVGAVGKSSQKNLANTIFEMPTTIIDRFCRFLGLK